MKKIFVFVALIMFVLSACGAPAPTSTPEYSLCPLPGGAGPGMFLGNKSAPLPKMQGIVMRIVKAEPPIELEETKITVRFVDVYYSGTVVATGLMQPTKGEIQELYINEKKMELSSTDISSGCIQTKEYGSFPVLFTANIMSSYGIIVMTPEQITKFK